MSNLRADVVICGAGILGVSTAFQLAVVHKQSNILLIDERPPLTLTSDKSTEAYRNWWPGPGDAMVDLMNRSITLMENMARQSNNIFNLNRRGYLYVTTDPITVPHLQASAEEASALGAGEVREHATGDSYIPHHVKGFVGSDGADLFTKPEIIQKYFPYISRDAVAALHVRRAGWLSGQTYGMWMLEQAKKAGVQLLTGHVAAIDTSAGKVSSATLEDSSQVQTGIFVIAAGPHLAAIGRLLGIDIPVTNELHLKAAFNDHLGAIGRDAPLVICADSQRLDWTEEERALLAEEPETAWLLDTLPSGAHARPEGDATAQSILALWDIHNQPVDPSFAIPEDPMYAELAVRGLSRILPGFRSYIGHLPRPQIDGGYYTKTRENRPLAGPLPITGAYVIGAAAGYGIMASAALGELLASHIVGSDLPKFAALFDLARYEDPTYKTLLKNWGDSWQL